MLWSRNGWHTEEWSGTQQRLWKVSWEADHTGLWQGVGNGFWRPWAIKGFQEGNNINELVLGHNSGAVVRITLERWLRQDLDRAYLHSRSVCSWFCGSKSWLRALNGLHSWDMRHKNQAYQTKVKPKTNLSGKVSLHWLDWTHACISTFYLNPTKKIRLLKIKNSQEDGRDDEW